MKSPLNLLRAATAVLLFAALPLAAQTAQAEQPNPISGGDASKPATSDKITAATIVRELRAMGFQAEVSADSKGNPRIATVVDGYKWVIELFGCTTSEPVEERTCTNAVFSSGYIFQNPISAAKMNQWNTNKRFARAYVYKSDDGKYVAMIDIDVYFADTGADPAKMFRQYFDIMRIQARDFRKHTDFS